jgi:hypothetical protein
LSHGIAFSNRALEHEDIVNQRHPVSTP